MWRLCRLKISLAPDCQVFLYSLLLVCGSLLSTNSLAAEDSRVLTLSAAIEKTFAYHPDLKLYRLREQNIDANLRIAGRRQALTLEATAENFMGNGHYTQSNAAEFSLSISSAIEFGGKRKARQSVVNAGKKTLSDEQASQSLDLVAEVTRRYIDVVVMQEKKALAEQAVTFTRQAILLVQRRVQAGAEPKAEILRARAADAQARMMLDRAQNQLLQARYGLALLWGETKPLLFTAGSDLFAIEESGDFESLYLRAINSPSINQFTSERRLAEAQKRLATTQGKMNLAWTLGVRQLQETNDIALLAGLSIPLFAQGRSKGQIEKTHIKLKSVTVRKEAALLQLRKKLFAAYQQREQAVLALRLLQNEVLPLLSLALEETRKAYHLGRYSYLEWVSARRELLVAQNTLIEMAAAAHRYQTDIEQMTSEPLQLPAEIEFREGSENE